jgi:hypothetical protein
LLVEDADDAADDLGVGPAAGRGRPMTTAAAPHEELAARGRRLPDPVILDPGTLGP